MKFAMGYAMKFSHGKIKSGSKAPIAPKTTAKNRHPTSALKSLCFLVRKEEKYIRENNSQRTPPAKAFC
jgi:hypothetical protein